PETFPFPWMPSIVRRSIRNAVTYNKPFASGSKHGPTTDRVNESPDGLVRPIAARLTCRSAAIAGRALYQLGRSESNGAEAVLTRCDCYGAHFTSSFPLRRDSSERESNS